MGWGPDAPDMTAANTAAASGARISQEQWDYYRNNIAPRALDQMDEQTAIGRDTFNLSRDSQQFQMGLARRYNDRYWSTNVPLQDRIIAENNVFDTEGRREELAGQANADVNSAFSSAREQEARGLSRMGVDPGSGRALALGNQTSIAQAAASAGAMAKVRAAARAEGYGRQMDSNAILSGLSGFSSSANSASNSALGLGLNASQNGMNGITGATNAMNSTGSSAANGLQNASSNMRGNAIESARSPGFDAMMGLAAGGMRLWGASDRRLKTDIVRVGTLDTGLPVYTFRYKAGGPTLMGVMADEVEQLLPGAVHKRAIEGEYDAVNYAML